MKTDTENKLTARDFGLYLGCTVQHENGSKGTLVDVSETDIVMVDWHTRGKEYSNINKITPVLRPLSDLSRDEFREIFNDPKSTGSFVNQRIKMISESRQQLFHYMSLHSMKDSLAALLALHFDLNNWIDASLAIDATKVII